MMNTWDIRAYAHTWFRWWDAEVTVFTADWFIVSSDWPRWAVPLRGLGHFLARFVDLPVGELNLPQS